MADSPYLDESWRLDLAALERRSPERGARPNQDPMRDWTPPSAKRGEVTLAEPPRVVSDEPDTERDGARLVTYDDGSVWRAYTAFSPFTERQEMQYERIKTGQEPYRAG